MNAARFDAITSQYPTLRLAVVGDFCLDRYLEIDPSKAERSLETGLPVHNVVNVRSQPGAAGTIVNNLVALGIGEIFPVGFAGEDGEGLELTRALRHLRGLNLEHFFDTPLRRTFTYTKPLLVQAGQAPIELNRLDFKNWMPTPAAVEGRIVDAVKSLAQHTHGLILLDQVELADTGVITRRVLEALVASSPARRPWPVVADSRRGLRGFPPLIFKMNARELSALTDVPVESDLADIKSAAAALAKANARPVIVTLAERGIVGAAPGGIIEHVPSLPLRGEIDIVGAGDAVTANVAAALAAGGSLGEAIELANAAASVVIHQLGTTGTATVAELAALVCR